VPEYWILRPDTRDVLICTQPDGSPAEYTTVQRFGPDTQLVSLTLPIRVPVARLFDDQPRPAR
jgi:hypothetical protein